MPLPRHDERQEESSVTRSIIKPLLSLLGAAVALVGVVEATAAVRRRGEQPPSKGFPWEEQTEAELESGDGRTGQPTTKPYSGASRHCAFWAEVPGSSGRWFTRGGPRRPLARGGVPGSTDQ